MQQRLHKNQTQVLRPRQGQVPHHMSPRQELQPRSEKKKKEVLTRCRRWKRELWGCRSHRLRQELRLRQGCRQGNRTSRWRLGLGSAGTLAGGSSSLPGGEVGCVKQTISSQSDGYRQLRCLLDLAQDEPISQNPPEIACHPEQSANLSQPALPLSGEKEEGLARAGKSFIKPLEGLRASCHLPKGLVSWLSLPTTSLGHRQQPAEGEKPAHLASTLPAPFGPTISVTVFYIECCF